MTQDDPSRKSSATPDMGILKDKSPDPLIFWDPSNLQKFHRDSRSIPPKNLPVIAAAPPVASKRSHQGGKKGSPLLSGCFDLW